jgi:hypothetical protein
VENKFSALDNSYKSKEAGQKHNLFNNSNLLFFLFLSMINNNNKTFNFPDKNSNLSEEYVVAIEEAPINKPIFQLNNTNEIYNMMENIKPYLSTKNQHAITVLERGRKIAQDINELFIMDPLKSTQASSSIDPDTIVNLLSDIKPYINRDYHNQIEDFSKGINHIVELQKNINHLENTLSTIRTIKDDAKKIENIIHSIKPFLPKDKKNTIGQLENISQVVDLIKSSNILNQDTEKSSEPTKKTTENQSNFIELMDMLDSSPITEENKLEANPTPIKEDQP